MKVPLTWLKDYVDIPMDVKTLAHRLTMNGLAVEGIVENDPFPGIRVGRVLEVEKLPNADKLSLTRVDIGSEVLAIVCGAPNVAAGQLVPVATVGTHMPNGLEIKKAKIRGAESSGMICSKSELGFEEGKSEGIWPLESDRPHRLGQTFGEFLGQSETILDIDVTSNRPDCLSMTGIAREIAVILNNRLQWPDVTLRESSEQTRSAVSVDIEDASGCSKYAARVLRHVRPEPSPSWLAKRLESAGLRSINVIVDVTNYVMLETGQPLHAFDYDRVSGHRIVVRPSRKGEVFATLDGKEHVLNEPTVMICDAEKAVALGGIMGGRNSEVTDGTTNVLLEAACFDALTIRRVSKRLGLTTDAAIRFGRGVDIERVGWALDRAASLIQQLTGGEVLAGRVDQQTRPSVPRRIHLRSTAVQRLLAKSIPAGEIVSILEKLECAVERQSHDFNVIPPSCRLDLNTEVDLIEEIARIHGYNQLPTSVGACIVYENDNNRVEQLTAKLRQTLRELGVDEVYTNSMVQAGLQTAVDPSAARRMVKLLNPISEDMAVMRVSILPGLLEVLRFNTFRENTDIRIYEMGRTYLLRADGLADERIVLAGCFSGFRTPVSWDHKPEPFDFFDLKRVVTTICRKLFIDNSHFIPYHDGNVYESTALQWNVVSQGHDRPLGRLGKIRKSVLRDFDIGPDVWAFEIDFDSLLEVASFSVTSRPVPKFPSVRRDLAFVVDDNVSAGVLLQMIHDVGGPFLEKTDVFDLYQGDQVPAGKKSLAFTLVFQAQDRTLTEDEVDQVMQTFIATAGQKYGAQLRT